MVTVRQMERLWHLAAYERLIDDLSVGRPEAVGGIRQLLIGAIPAAALTIIRAAELNQNASAHVVKMLHYLIDKQQIDGGFSDPATTAICLRALCSADGSGVAVERCFGYLRCLQKETGEWPREPLRRLPADPAVTAFVILQLTEARTAQADALVDETIDKLTSDVMTESVSGDAQLLPLRRRVASRHPELAGVWS